MVVKMYFTFLTLEHLIITKSVWRTKAPRASNVTNTSLQNMYLYIFKKLKIIFQTQVIRESLLKVFYFPNLKVHYTFCATLCNSRTKLRNSKSELLSVLLIATPTLYHLHVYGRHKLTWVIYIQQSKIRIPIRKYFLKKTRARELCKF